MGARQFGARVTRLEDPALLAGAGRFVDDVSLPGRAVGLLRAQPARPCAHPGDRYCARRSPCPACTR